MRAQTLANPSPLTRLRGDVDTLFERFFGDYEPFRAWEPLATRRFPALNVWQDDNNIYVEAELPGVVEKDIDLSIISNELTIKGQRPAPEIKEGTTVHRRERGAGTFTRTLRLPCNIMDTRVEAVFTNGVLTVTLPKATAARSRHIPVKALAS